MAHPADSPVAIVTGAGAGIGRAAALALNARGWRVCLAARTNADLCATRDACSEPANAFVMVTDIAEPHEAQHLVRETHAQLGRVDALINCAGFAKSLPIDETSIEIIEESFAVNAVGPAIAIATAWPIMKAQGAGRIINVSTLGTRDPFPGFFAYAGSKAPLNLFAQSCAKEGAPFGIKAFAVAPGAVETRMLRSLFDEEAIPSSVCFTPEEVAGIIAACACGERDSESGSTIFLTK